MALRTAPAPTLVVSGTGDGGWAGAEAGEGDIAVLVVVVVATPAATAEELDAVDTVGTAAGADAVTSVLVCCGAGEGAACAADCRSKSRPRASSPFSEDTWLVHGVTDEMGKMDVACHTPLGGGNSGATKQDKLIAKRTPSLLRQPRRAPCSKISPSVPT